MNAKALKFWGAGTARTLRPIWMAEELDIEYELFPIGPRTGETRTKEYTDLNPKQKIPCIQDGGFVLSESLSICRYLQNVYPSDSIAIPKTKEDLAREDEWCNYIYGEMDETTLYVMRRHYDLTDIYGESPVVVEACRDYLERHLEVVDKHLEQNKTVLEIGFGLADIMLVSCLDWAIFYNFDLKEATKDYHKNMIQRPNYIKAKKINYA